MKKKESGLRSYLKSIEDEFWRKKRSSIVPSVLQFDYLHMRSLVEAIKKALTQLPKNKKYKILDVGCGNKPYQSLFSPFTKSYIGVDLDRRVADVVAPAEKLPFGSNSFDLVVCFQTLEHCQNPLKVVAEIKRVLKPKGYVLLTAPGIWMHHPSPHDYYRWTHEGLRELFKSFSEVSAEATLNSWSSLLQLVNVELYSLACRRWYLKTPLYGIIALFNVCGKILLPFGQKHLTIGYVVIARK